MKNELTKRLSLLASMAVCILIIFASCAFADTVKLKNGGEFQGHLKEITDKTVVLELKLGDSKGTIGLKIADVESVNNLSIEEAKTKLAAEGAFISGDKGKAAVSSSAGEGQDLASKAGKSEFESAAEAEVISEDKIRARIKQDMEEGESRGQRQDFNEIKPHF